MHNFKFYTEPYLHQKFALNFIKNLDSNNAGLFMEMGTGKTKVMIDWFHYLWLHESIKSLLILCPLSVIDVWVKEFIKHAPCFVPIVATGSKDAKLQVFNYESLLGNYKIVITNYETMRSLFKYEKKNNLNTDVRWIPDMVILDESTKIKNLKAQVTKIMLSFSKFVEYKYVLSGKPITRNPFDIYSQLKFLDNKAWDGMTFSAFKKTVAITEWTGMYEKVLLWQNLDWLRKQIEKKAVVLDKESAGIKLPKKVKLKRYASLKDKKYKKQAVMYKLAVQENLLWIKEQSEMLTISNLLAKMGKLQQILAGFTYYDDNNNQYHKRKVERHVGAKLDVLEEIFEELDDSEQVIIWTVFKEEMEIVAEFLHSKDIKYTMIAGGMNNELRSNNIESFSKGTKRVLISQVAAGAYGLNLTNARYCIYFTNTFNYEHRIQSEDRIHRIGQNKTCYYIDIVVKGSIDELVLENHRLKEQLSTDSLPLVMFEENLSRWV